MKPRVTYLIYCVNGEQGIKRNSNCSNIIQCRQSGTSVEVWYAMT